MLNLSIQPPLSLYIHTPWCVKKCPYCDFNSHNLQGELPEQEYLQAIIADLENDLFRVWGRRVNSIFIGGGTPSLLSPDFYDRLLSDLRARLMLNTSAEITMEANPGTVDSGRFAEYKALGINRLSIGVQSLNDKHLQSLGRIHNSSDAKKAVEVARNAGFDNYNLDLMFGLPEQSVSEAESDFNELLNLEPSHVSYYQLTIEPNTLFYQKRPELPGDDISWSMQKNAIQFLEDQGFQQYEVSAYAKPDKQCFHNRNYWEFGDYLGIGAGAHSKLTDVNGRVIGRLIKEKHPREYMNKSSTKECIIKEQTLTRKDLPVEFMINALRLKNGFATSLFAERTGLPISAIDSQLKQAEQAQLLDWSLTQIKPTERGFQFLNDLQEIFLPD